MTRIRRNRRGGTILSVVVMLWSAAVLTITPAGAATSCEPPGTDPAYTVCQGPYALCDAAACEPIWRKDENGEPYADFATCLCKVETGWNVGPTSCAFRDDAAARGQLVSTYSFALTEHHPTMTCTRGAYTDCYGYPCVGAEDGDPWTTCTCKMVDNEAEGDFVTLGGECQTGTCESVLWSAATREAIDCVNQALAAAMIEAGAQPPAPNWCPASP